MLKIGHRGASGYEPENTLRSFKKAIELGADMIEFDVHICKSGETVVMHDEKVNRTTNGRGRVGDKTLEELKKLDAGKGEKISTLEEVLDFVDKRVQINIELKGNGTVKPVAEIIKKYIQKYDWAYGDFLISSFDNKKLKKMRRLDAKIKIGIVASDNMDFLDLASELGAYSINLSSRLKKFLKKEIIGDLHKRGIKILVWTVNKKSDIEKLRSIGVDGIFSDYPDFV